MAIVSIGTKTMCMCAMGTAPAPLKVLPDKLINGEKMPMANIMDNKPMVNIGPFATCNSMANPQTAAQTAAAMGVLTPGACVPVIPAPWVPGSPMVMAKGFPALSNSCQLMCAYGGAITISNPGCTITMVQ